MPKPTFFNLTIDKQNRIIDAAIDQFSQFHYSNVTIDKLVKQAGIPKGSFYQYFDNKDDLYIYLFTEVGDTKNHLFYKLKAEIPNISFREYLLQYIGQLKKLESTSTKMLKLKTEFLNQCPQEIKQQILRSELPKSAKLIEEVISAYKQKGEFRQDLNCKTAAYVTIMSLSNLQYYTFGDGEDALTALANIIDFLASGMEIYKGSKMG